MGKLKYPHPGEILREEFLAPMGITQYRLAVETGMPHSRVTALVHARVGVSADTAMRLSKFFGGTARFWLNLQTEYDLREAQAERGGEYDAIHVCPEVASHAA